MESSGEENNTYEPEESPEDSPEEHSSTPESNDEFSPQVLPEENDSEQEYDEKEIEEFIPEGDYLSDGDQPEENIIGYCGDEFTSRETESPQRTPVQARKQNKINKHKKPSYYSSSEETDSDDERIREKLRRKRSLKQQQYNKLRDDSSKDMQIACQSNSLNKINNTRNNNNKIYLVSYRDDGNKTATYHSALGKPGVKGQTKLTLHQTKYTKGVHFQSLTQFAAGHRSTEKEIGEERFLQLENPKRLPEITIGALYVEEISDYEDLSEEDENNNYLIDPDEIDRAKHNINLESMGMREVNGKSCWSQLVEESSRRYTSAANQKEPEKNKAVIKGGNGEEQSYGIDNGMFAKVPGGENHVKAETTGHPNILRALLERATRDDIH